MLSIAAATSAGKRSEPAELVTEGPQTRRRLRLRVGSSVERRLRHSPLPATPARSIKQIQALHPRELKLRLVGFYVRYFRRATPPGVMAAAADGDPAAIREFVATRAIRTMPCGSRRSLPSFRFRHGRHVAESWAACAAGRNSSNRSTSRMRCWPRLPSAGSRQRPNELSRWSQPSMDGWDYVAEPGINAVLLVPSLAIWPNSHVFDHQSTKLICYPLAPKPSLKESEPPGRSAGAIPGTRRRTAAEDSARASPTTELTAQEIANRLAIGLTTLLHHLDVLRESGLVSVSAGRRRTYRLRRGALTQLGTGIERDIYFTKRRCGIDRRPIRHA